MEGSIGGHIGGLNVNFHISSKGLHIVEVELRYVVLKSKEKIMQFLSIIY